MTDMALIEPLPLGETVVVTDARLDPDKLMLDGVDTAKEPHFTVSEVAKVFFARTSHWIRWLESQQAFILDGENVAERRTDKGARVYTLADVERMTHALAVNGKINGAQAANALHIVQTIARVWGYLA